MKVGIYRHYKGGLYEVLGIGKHSETLEEFIVYKPLYESKKYDIDFWIRPIDIFSEKILIDGEEVERFKYIGDLKYEDM